MDIRFGAPVLAEDGQVGILQRIILHPHTQEVEAIVVVDQQILPHDILVPVDRIAQAGQRLIKLRGTVEEIRGLDGFAASQYVDAPEGWLPPVDRPHGVYLLPASPYLVGAFGPSAGQLPPTERQFESKDAEDVDLNDGTEVICSGGLAGRLSHVLTVGDTDHMSHLVVRRPGIPSREVIVPVGSVVALGDDGVVIDMSEEELDELPLAAPTR